MTGNWYIMQRGWMDGFKPEPFTEREAFLWSIEQAAWEDHTQWFNGQSIPVQRGEFVTSLRAMEKAFGWSLKKVRGFLIRMGKDEKWAHRQAHGGAQSPTIVTVLNYGKYQALPSAKGTAKGTGKGTRGAQQGHTTEQQELNIEISPTDSSLRSGADATAEMTNGGGPDSPPTARSQLLPVPAGQGASGEIDRAFAKFEDLRREFLPRPRPLRIDADRRKKLALRLREIGGADAWDEVMTRIRGSPYLHGANGPPFVTIDKLLEAAFLRKVMEGNYDDQTDRAARRRPDSTSPLDAMRNARAVLGFN